MQRQHGPKADYLALLRDVIGRNAHSGHPQRPGDLRCWRSTTSPTGRRKAWRLAAGALEPGLSRPSTSLDLSLLKTWMPRHIGEPSGLAFGKPKDELHDAIL